MRRLHNYSNKNDALYLCSDIRNEEQTSIGHHFKYICSNVMGPLQSILDIKKIKSLMYSHIHILITKKNIIIKSITILYSSH